MSLLQRFRKKERGPLADEPGPSPWFLPPLDGAGGAGRALTWRHAGSEASASAKRFLVDGAAGDILLVDAYCWAQPLGASHLLVWHQTKRSAVERGAEVPAVHIHLFNLAELRSLEDAARACQELDAGSESVSWAGGHVRSYEASAIQATGAHHIVVPESLREARELFLLVDAALPPDSPRIHLWIVQPGAGTLEVLPQNWFNDGSFDFGSQWITRVAREPVSGRLAGEGIRLRPFVLDESGAQIKDWLTVNPFESGKRS